MKPGFIDRRVSLKTLGWTSALILGTGSGGLLAASFLQSGGYLELDTRSEYSHIRILRRNNVRTLIFVRDSGEEAYESQVDLDRPYELHFAYLRDMFASYFFRPKPERVLIVGLGGGSMVHFLRRYDPGVRVDAIEIDPVVVDIAKKYFGVRADDKVKILTGDGIKYLQTTESRYDVIYMDAFLKPSGQTDNTGAPLRLRTLDFYRDVQKRLNPKGLVVINLNPHPDIDEDLRTIRAAFRHVYVFHLPNLQGKVVVGSIAPEREEWATLRRRAPELDRRFGMRSFFQSIFRHLER